MHPINIKTSNTSNKAAMHHSAGNTIPNQANPIDPRAGFLHGQKGSEKQERSIQSPASPASPRASEKKLNEEPITLDQALSIKNPQERDAALLEIAKDINIFWTESEAAIRALSTPEKCDEAWIARATNTNLATYDRMDAALNISVAHSLIKDKVLLEIANNINLPYREHEALINGLSSQDKQDEAWIARATNPNLDGYEHMNAALNISDTIIRDKILVKLYNEAMNPDSKSGSPAMIINAIQNPELKTLVREAFAAGEILRLNSPKSARNI